jgi:hypothetical protein
MRAKVRFSGSPGEALMPATRLVTEQRAAARARLDRAQAIFGAVSDARLAGITSVSALMDLAARELEEAKRVARAFGAE